MRVAARLLLAGVALGAVLPDGELRPELVQPDVGILQPLGDAQLGEALDLQLQNHIPGKPEAKEQSCHIQVLLRRRAVQDGREQAFLHLTSDQGTLLRWLWQPDGKGDSHARLDGHQVIITTTGALIEDTPGPQLLKLDIAATGEVHWSIDGRTVGTFHVPFLWPLQSAKLYVGRAFGLPEADFSGDVFDVKAWTGFASSDGLPSLHLRRAQSCPWLHVTELPWAQLRDTVEHVLSCTMHPLCDQEWKRHPPYRLLVEIADPVLYADHEAYREIMLQCPMGFAMAFALVSLHAQIDQRSEAASVYGTLKLVSTYFSLEPAEQPEPTFGGARPLRLLRRLGVLVRKRLLDSLSFPAEGLLPRSSRNEFWSAGAHGNRTSFLVSETRAPQHFSMTPDARLCVEVVHDTKEELSLLRNTVETLAAGGLASLDPNRGPLLVIRLSQGCDGVWTNPTTPEGWYLSWLLRRFSARLVCSKEADGCSALPARLVLLVTTNWHMLPFRPELVWSRLQSAANLLLTEQGSRRVSAVSMSEKRLQGLPGVEGSGGRALRGQARNPKNDDFRNLLLSAPSLVGDWNLTAAEGFLTSIYELDARREGSTRWSMTEINEAVQPCSGFTDHMCAPESWWGNSRRGDDVWLLRIGDAAPGVARATSSDSAVAISTGLFQLTKGNSYNALPSSSEGLGTPDCYACHLLPTTGDFTLYVTTLDVLGPCRELFSNLLLDALEALQLASFQGPQVVLTEPFISNAVWQRYGEEQAAKLKAEGKVGSIYSYWNQKTACGLRHGSATRFGELFDWPGLVKSLKRTRGIKGQVSWEEFLERTGSIVDVAAMLADHPNSPEMVLEKRVLCGDDTAEPIRLSFFESELLLKRRVCVRNTAEHSTGFELRFMDEERLRRSVQAAVTAAKLEGRNWASVGLYLYWVEGAERARLHPGRYGRLSSHVFYPSMWKSLRFSDWVLQRAARVARQLGLVAASGRERLAGTGQRQPFMAVHWRKGDWFLGPHPRKLEQAELAEPPRFAEELRRQLAERGLRRIFLMSNAGPGSEAVRALARELKGTAELVQAPVLFGDRYNLRQLCVEMAIASAADFFLAFGDGLVEGHVSMPSLLVIQMRLHAEAWPLLSNGFSFAPGEVFAKDTLGL